MSDEIAAGHQPDKPVAGFYRMRLIRNGPFVPVRIWYGPSFDPATGDWCDRSPMWRCCIGGKQESIWRAWPQCAGRPISEVEYRYMRASEDHASKFEPDMPQARPWEPINLQTMRPVF